MTPPRPPQVPRPGGPASEFADAAQLDVLRYSRVWEDPRLLAEALGIGPDDEILSIASAGDNVLALLLEGPRRIVALDASPAQIALVELKLAALRRLDHDGFVGLLGLTPDDERLARYAEVRPLLSAQAQRFWDDRPELVAAGLVEAGALDRHVRAFVDRLRDLLPDRELDAFLDAPNVEAQAAWVSRTLGSPAIEAAFRDHFGAAIAAAGVRDPAQRRYAAGLEPGDLVLGRFREVLSTLPVGDNFFLRECLAAPGSTDLETTHPYLRRSSYPRLVANAHRVQIVTGALERWLDTAPPGSLAGANLSDVFEYMSPESTARTFAALARAVRPGGRIAYWNFLVERTSPPASPWRRLDISDALHAADRVWFYRAFHVEERQASPPAAASRGAS